MNWRNIVINGKLWKYCIGRYHVVARSDTVPEVKCVGTTTEVTGMTWDEVAHAKHKGYFMITPKMIEEWLKGEMVV